MRFGVKYQICVINLIICPNVRMGGDVLLAMPYIEASKFPDTIRSADASGPVTSIFCLIFYESFFAGILLPKPIQIHAKASNAQLKFSRKLTRK